MRHALALLFVVVAASHAAAARAQTNEAAAHFRAGLEQYELGHYEIALPEISRAYELDPRPELLYNLGLVHARLGHAVEAADALTRFLAEAPATRLRRERRLATEELARQSALVALVRVVTDVPATVTLGDHDVGTTPLAAPLRVTSGRVVVGVHAAGYEPERRELEVAGGDDREVRFELRAVREARGTLRVVSRLVDVEVRIDDEPVGRTPLGQTFPRPTGVHHVEGRRAGYVTQRVDVDLADGTEREVRLDLDLDAAALAGMPLGTVVLRLPEPHFAVQIDGTPATLSVASFQQPAGPHRVHVEVNDRAPVDLDVRVEAGATVTLTPPLVWTPEGRARRVSAAGVQREVGSMITGGGASFAVAAPVLWIVAALHGWGAHASHLRADVGACTSHPIPLYCASLPRIDVLESELSTIEFETAWWVAGATLSTVLAIVGIAVGLPTWLGAPSDADVDRASHAASAPRVRLGGTGVALDF